MKTNPLLPVILSVALLTQTSHAQSQAQMNMEAGQALAKSDAKLNALYQRIVASVEIETTSKKNLQIAQRAWLQFVEAQIKTVYPLEEGENPREVYGSIYPAEFALLKTELIKRRIRQLEEILPSPPSAVITKIGALKQLKRAREEMQAAYKQVLAMNDEDPGFPSVLKQSQTAWEKYVQAQLFSEFPLREEEQKVPEVVYGPTYVQDHASAAIKLIQQRIEVLNGM